MNELVTQQQEQGLAISSETKELIQSSVADSTLKRYQRLSFLSDILSGFQGKIENLDPVNTRVLPVSISKKMSDNLTRFNYMD